MPCPVLILPCFPLHQQAKSFFTALCLKRGAFACMVFCVRTSCFARIRLLTQSDITSLIDPSRSGPKAARMYSEARENAMANEKLKGAPEQKVQVLRDGFSNFGQVYKVSEAAPIEKVSAASSKGSRKDKAHRPINALHTLFYPHNPVQNDADLVEDYDEESWKYR